MYDLIFASNNPHKIREITSMIGTGFRILGMNELGINDDIPENESTLEGNALEKVRYIHKLTGQNAFADDTGLEVEALNCLPGVHSARFAGESKDSAANIRKLLSMLSGINNRRARFRTVIALIYLNKEYLFEGTVSGEIINEPRGTEGFGYDPVFVPDGMTSTFAEIPLDVKNTISHRARAFLKLKSFLEGMQHA